MIRTVLVDDHPVVRFGLRSLIDGQEDLSVVGEAGARGYLLELLSRGLSNKDLARELFVSQATVNSHLSRIYAKLGVDSRAAAVATAIERRIIRT